MISTKKVLVCTRASLASIKTTRLFETERGYQGALVTELTVRLGLPPHIIVEQEYQKQAQEHGLTIRPDIIVHEPFDTRRHRNRTDGNVAVFELKLKASPQNARDDFDNLASILRRLNYRLGVFVNINSTETHADQLPRGLRDKIACFAVTLVDGKPKIKEGS